MQLQQLIYFAKIAELGSINKAAAVLFITQPNLSRAMMNLETELEIKIFERSNKGVSLTGDGKKLYRYTRTILDQMELIDGIAIKEAPQILSIASYPIITMSRLMGEFYQKHMNQEIRIQLLEQRLQKVIETVESGEAELGFLMYNDIQAKEVRQMLKYKNIELNYIGTDTWYTNIGPNSPLYGKESVTIQDLLQYPIVRMPDDYFSNLTFYLTIDGVALTEFKKVVYMGDSAAVLNMLKYTDVFRFGPGISREDFSEYNIKTIPIRNCDVKIRIAWIKRKKELLSEEAAEFIQLLVRQVESSLL